MDVGLGHGAGGDTDEADGALTQPNVRMAEKGDDFRRQFLRSGEILKVDSLESHLHIAVCG